MLLAETVMKDSAVAGLDEGDCALSVLPVGIDAARERRSLNDTAWLRHAPRREADYQQSIRTAPSAYCPGQPSGAEPTRRHLPLTCLETTQREAVRTARPTFAALDCHR